MEKLWLLYDCHACVGVCWVVCASACMYASWNVMVREILSQIKGSMVSSRFRQITYKSSSSSSSRTEGIRVSECVGVVVGMRKSTHGPDFLSILPLHTCAYKVTTHFRVDLLSCFAVRKSKQCTNN